MPLHLIVDKNQALFGCKITGLSIFFEILFRITGWFMTILGPILNFFC
jgi:hypothetical protein